MPLVPVLAYMERNGVRVDTEALKQTSEHFTARMNQIEEGRYEVRTYEDKGITIRVIRHVFKKEI